MRFDQMVKSRACPSSGGPEGERIDGLNPRSGGQEDS
jgi:hypothetical protein